MKFKALFALVLCVAVAQPTLAASAKKLIKVDGSSTVYPITEAVAEEFQKSNRNVNVVVGISGTGGGFKKFIKNETDISDASRPIKAKEAQALSENNIAYIELPVAFDGIAIVVNPKNNWVKSITINELKKMWEPEAQGKIKKWNQINPAWPDKEIHLFGAGVDSGTYDYFTEAVVGKEHASRGDFTSSEDDNVLVQGVSTDPYALGFVPLAYYESNSDKLRAVAVNGVMPTYEAVAQARYQPLARPLFIYVNTKSAEKPEVRSFVEFYLKNAAKLSKEVGYIELPAEAYALVTKRFEQRKTGSVFGAHGSQVGVKIADILRKE